MNGQREPPDEVERWLGATVGGKYRILRLLGRGGMGAVFAAENTLIGKRVALKFLSAEAARDRDAARRFQREAQAASRIESEHIVQVFDAGSTPEGLPFLVMEHLTGEDLRARLTREGQLAVADAVAIGLQVLRGLVRAHAAGIVHRDLKPDNVFLCARDDGSMLVKLVDFGISKLDKSTMSERLTRRGTVLGSAYYMSPEQAQASDGVDQRSDLYGVGAMLFEMLAGRPPHSGPTLESVLVAICTQQAPSLASFRPDAPLALVDAIARALEREPGARFASAAEFIDALAPVRASYVPRARRGLPRTLVGGIVATLIGFTVTAALVSKGARAPAPAASATTPATALAAAPAAEGPLVTPVLDSQALTPKAPVSASPVASGSAEPRPTRPVTKATSPKRRAASSAPDAGVASSLQLSTREP
jgi:eukaryotic-like serine/threonine-protein kinase